MKAPSLFARLARRTGTLTFDDQRDYAPAISENFQLAKVAQLVRELLPPDGELLDIGCWTGSLALALEPSMRRRYTGVDIEPASQAIEVARGMLPEGRFAVTRSVESLPFDPKSFDLITFIDVIEHVPPGRESFALAELARVLRPGGSIIVKTPYHNVLNVTDPAWFFGHRHYSIERLRRLAQAQALRVTEFEFSGGIWTNLDIDVYYVHKHLLHRPYVRPEWLRKRVAGEHERAGRRILPSMIWCRLVREAT